MDRRNPYETAFEAYLRSHRLPYLATDETHRTTFDDVPLKSLDFMVMLSQQRRLLIDVKGRRFPGGTDKKPRRVWENWSTQDDITSLIQWATHLGPHAQSLLVFVYALAPNVVLPSDTPDVWTHHDSRYLLRAVDVESYRRWMRVRSPRWRTVCLPSDVFRELVRPFSDFLEPAHFSNG